MRSPWIEEAILTGPRPPQVDFRRTCLDLRLLLARSQRRGYPGKLLCGLCAAHNISLAGVAEGLAVTWETGGATRHPKLKETLGAEKDWMLATMLSVGVPGEFPASLRTPLTNFVHWHE